MKKIVFIMAFICLLTSCGVQQNLNRANRLRSGMSMDEVERIMGYPAVSDFYRDVEEWHYCKTGFYSDRMLALFFYRENLIAKRFYSVSLRDGGSYGSCESNVRRGSYREPDIVTEIRLR
jgi:hypothetical protein